MTDSERFRAGGIGPDAGPGERLDSATKFSARPGALDELRDRMDVLVTALAEHPEPSWELDEAQWRATELAEELARPRLSAPRVRSRWMRLAPLLHEVLPEVSITTMSSLLDDAL